MSGDDSQQLILSPLSLDNSHSPLTDPNHVDRGRHPQFLSIIIEISTSKEKILIDDISTTFCNLYVEL